MANTTPYFTMIPLAKVAEVTFNCYIHACMSGWLDSVLSINDHGKKNDPEFVKSLLTTAKLKKMASGMIRAFIRIIHNDSLYDDEHIPQETKNYIVGTIDEKLIDLRDTGRYRFEELLDTSYFDISDVESYHTMLSFVQEVFEAYALGIELSETDNHTILSTSINAVLFLGFAAIYNNGRMEIPLDKNGLRNLSYLSLFQHALSDKSLVPMVERAVATAYYQMHLEEGFEIEGLSEDDFTHMDVKQYINNMEKLAKEWKAKHKK